MLGVINKKERLNAVFEQLHYCKEVYSTQDFKMSDDCGEFTLLCSQGISYSVALYEMQRCFESPIHLYVTYDPLSHLFEGNRIIWREGVWYV